jgi:DNA-binding transcriptional LysR family regulator
VAERAAQLGRDEAASRLAVLCLPALSHALLPAACADFLAQHPAAELAITPQESPLLEEWMSAQRFDLGLSESGQPAPGTRLTPLLQLDEVAVLPAGHRLLARRLLEPADFAGEDFVSLSPEDPYRRQLDALFAQAGIERRLRLETHSAVAVCALVQQGLGLAIVNPLTALACATPGSGLALRRLTVSVPFRVNALLPEFRPTQPLASALLDCLHASAAALPRRLAEAY